MWGPITRAAALIAFALAWLPGAACADAPPFVGAATHPLSFDSAADAKHDLDLLKGAGATTVRIDMGWSTLEQDGKGQFSPGYVAKADAFFAEAHARGLKAIVTFLGSPCWASSAPPDVKQNCNGQWWTRGVDLYPPSDPADFGDAAAFVTKRWGADIAALEVWNEPNFDYYFKTSNAVADYATLLKATYPKVKAVSGVPVIGGALLGNDQPFLDGLYAAGIQPYTDGISIHPYTIGNDPGSTADSTYGYKYHLIQGVPRMRASMVANGDFAKKLWITELGWSSCLPGGTSSWCVTTATQAQYVTNALRAVRDCWNYVQAVAIYTLRNTGTSATDRESQMGLIYPDYTQKPAFSAFAGALADLRANPGVGAPGAGTAACGAAGGGSGVPPGGSGVPPGGSSQPPLGPSLPRPAPQRPSSARDTAAPVVRSLRLRPATIRRGARTRVSWKLSEAARLTFTVERLRGRGWVRERGSFARAAKAGSGELRFLGRLGSRTLPAGRYRLVAAARDGSGTRSQPVRAPFRVRPARSAHAASH